MECGFLKKKTICSTFQCSLIDIYDQHERASMNQNLFRICNIPGFSFCIEEQTAPAKNLLCPAEFAFCLLIHTHRSSSGICFKQLVLKMKVFFWAFFSPIFLVAYWCYRCTNKETPLKCHKIAYFQCLAVQKKVFGFMILYLEIKTGMESLQGSDPLTSILESDRAAKWF